ncbi:hypothetical protein GCM10020358_56000 [Amorphoplanes nipponensis]|uniref:Uncharacterized protein n=1 Tax=Actinoplanes nipponensis TaxID=135950 RepID=A0A919MNT6_9ACTN|nr:hypothetical protein Ani05nite_54400 [Actinoplanes nipponensis]
MQTPAVHPCLFRQLADRRMVRALALSQESARQGRPITKRWVAAADEEHLQGIPAYAQQGDVNGDAEGFMPPVRHQPSIGSGVRRPAPGTPVPAEVPFVPGPRPGTGAD